MVPMHIQTAVTSQWLNMHTCCHAADLQDHREKRSFGLGKFYQFMMRTRQPSGLVTNQLYLVMDELADKVRPV